MNYAPWPGIGYSTKINMDDLTKPARKAAGAAKNLKKRREEGTDTVTTIHGLSKKADAMNRPPAMIKAKKRPVPVEAVNRLAREIEAEIYAEKEKA